MSRSNNRRRLLSSCLLVFFFNAVAIAYPTFDAVSQQPASGLGSYMDIVKMQTMELTEANCRGPLVGASWTENDCGFQATEINPISASMCTAASTGDLRPCFHAPQGTDDCSTGGNCDTSFRVFLKTPKPDFLQPSLFPQVNKMNVLCAEYEFEGQFSWGAPFRNKQCRNCSDNGPQIASGTYNNMANAQGKTHNTNDEGWHYYTILYPGYDTLPRVWHLGGNRYAACLPNAVQADRTRGPQYRPWGPPYGNNGLGTLWTSMTYLYYQFQNFECNSPTCSVKALRVHGIEIRDHIIWQPRFVHNAAAGQTYRFVLHNGNTKTEKMLVNIYGSGSKTPDDYTSTARVAWVDGNDNGVHEYTDSNNNNRCDPGEDAATADTCLLGGNAWQMPPGNHVIRIKLNSPAGVNTLHLMRENGLEGDTVYLSTGPRYTQFTDGASAATAALPANVRGWDQDADLCLPSQTCGGGGSGAPAAPQNLRLQP